MLMPLDKRINKLTRILGYVILALVLLACAKHLTDSFSLNTELTGKNYKVFSQPSPKRHHFFTQNCSKRNFAEPPLEVTVLASFPGSGNTWTRFLIEQVTGIYTGSVYHDSSLIAGGFLGEGVKNGSVSVVKTHRRMCPKLKTKNNREYRPKCKAILLIRNPLDAILSEFNRIFANHTSQAPEALLQGKSFNQHVIRSIPRWKTFNTAWLTNAEFTNKLLVIKYENLRKNVRKEVEKIVKFLNLEKFARFRCLGRNIQGNFKRKRKGDDFYDQHKYITEDLIAISTKEEKAVNITIAQLLLKQRRMQ